MPLPGNNDPVLTNKGKTRFQVQVTPRSAIDAVVGRHGQGFKIRLKAPPVDGRANEALIKFLSGVLKVKPASLTVVSGHTGRTKIMEIQGLSIDELTDRLLPKAE
ncbi:MAG: DUF167 domain-containing protein [Deltaproteobacteria bacterium]|nr:DUF167 domain-containing protein [Deltaproteobacteria bacterium]